MRDDPRLRKRRADEFARIARERDALEVERDQCKTELEAVTAERNRLRSERNNLADQVATLSVQLSTANQQIGRLESVRDGYKAEAAKCQEALNARVNKQAALQKLVASVVQELRTTAESVKRAGEALK